LRVEQPRRIKIGGFAERILVDDLLEVSTRAVRTERAVPDGQAGRRDVPIVRRARVNVAVAAVARLYCVPGGAVRTGVRGSDGECPVVLRAGKQRGIVRRML